MDNPKTTIGDEPKDTLVRHVLDSLPDGGLGVVHTVDGLVENLLVALSDFVADKQAELSAPQISTRPDRECTLTDDLSGTLCPFQAPCQPVLKGTISMTADTHDTDNHHLSCKAKDPW